MTEWYVAGGAIRDVLMGRPVHDVDISFAGGEASFLQCFPQARKTGKGLDIWLVGSTEFTQLAHVEEQDAAQTASGVVSAEERISEVGPAAPQVTSGVFLADERAVAGSVTIPERERTTSEDVALSDIQADLLSRDLTINAAAVDSEGRFFCHPRFMDDMRDKVLRLASERALEHDPLRVFRLARFAAELPVFSIAPDTLDAMRAFARDHRARFEELPRERVGRELMKAFAAPLPSRFLAVLQQTDCLYPWFREFVPAAEIPAGPLPWHDNSVLEHTMEVMDRCAGHPLAVWMGFCHDIGKIRTEEAMLPHHYGHELKGVDLVKAMGQRFCLPSRWIRGAVVGTLLHMKGGMYGSLRAGTRRDLLCQLHDAHIDHDFWLLAGADGGWDWEPMAERDLKAIQSVHLPREWRDRGEESGKRLRSMQCEAISRLPKFRPERAANAGDTPVPAYLQEQDSMK